jgi:hypothetical protein
VVYLDTPLQFVGFCRIRIEADPVPESSAGGVLIQFKLKITTLIDIILFKYSCIKFNISCWRIWNMRLYLLGKVP